MKVYAVCYDLNRPGQNYANLFQAIKSVANGWWHHLDSTWLITSDYTAEQIRDHLLPHIDSNDELLVARLSGESAWYGFDEVGSDWLRKALGAAVAA